MSLAKGVRHQDRECCPLSWDLRLAARSVLTRLALQPKPAHLINTELNRLGLDLDRRQVGAALRSLHGRGLVRLEPVQLYVVEVGGYLLTKEGEEALDELFEVGWSIVDAIRELAEGGSSPTLLSPERFGSMPTSSTAQRP